MEHERYILALLDKRWNRRVRTFGPRVIVTTAAAAFRFTEMKRPEGYPVVIPIGDPYPLNF